MQEWINPINGILVVESVFPIGVLQQLAYQRNMPLDVNRMQAMRSAPTEIASFACDI